MTSVLIIAIDDTGLSLIWIKDPVFVETLRHGDVHHERSFALHYLNQ
jgi:hypothetical protein